jgi:hypothetical protein
MLRAVYRIVAATIANRFSSSKHGEILSALLTERSDATLICHWNVSWLCHFYFRRALRRGESVKYLIQDVVIDYIKENHLYGVEDKWVTHAWTHSLYSSTASNSVNPFKHICVQETLKKAVFYFFFLFLMLLLHMISCDMLVYIFMYV